MTTKEAGQIVAKKTHDAILAAQHGEITGTERNRIMEEARDEYRKNIKASLCAS